MKHVIVIEDDRPPLRLLAWGLADASYNVTVARDVEAAVSAIRGPTIPDAVVFNTRASSDTKQDAIARIRDRAPAARIIDVADDEEWAVTADASLQPSGLSVNDVVYALDPPEWNT
jgi:DNA-binding NtrC family response regulator